MSSKEPDSIIVYCLFPEVVYLDGVLIKSPELKHEGSFGVSERSHKVEKWDPESKTVWVVKK